MRTQTSWQDLLRPGDAEDFFTRRPFHPFDPRSSYRLENALLLAELSRLIYRPDIEETDQPQLPTRSEILATAGLEQTGFFLSDETDTQAMLVEHVGEPAYAILVFRGTEQKLKDFVTDLRVGVDAVVGDDLAVHEGFRLALESVWPEIELALAPLTCPVFFAGHSLGGALATLAASRRRPVALYTFGSPRVGNDAFAATLAGIPIFRVVDDWDVVAVLPPEIMGFTHVGEAIELEEPPRPFSFSPLAWIKLMFSPAKPLADHAPVNYVDRL